MTAEPVVITEPGVYDIPEATYHADPVPAELGGSLSHSGAKKLLEPDCPAVFDHERRHPKPPTADMEFGTAIHKLVLGKGADVVRVDKDTWRTNEAKAAAKEARARGAVPLLAHDYAEAETIAAAVLADKKAGPLFLEGQAEQSLFWQCPEFGIWKRCRLDWLPSGYGRPIIVDLKKISRADPQTIRKSVHRYGYYMQDPFYREGYRAVFGEYPEFYFVFIQSEEPYLVTVADLEPDAIAYGEARCRLAAERFRDCTQAGTWPGYSEDIIHVSLPSYAEWQIESELSHDRDY